MFTFVNVFFTLIIISNGLMLKNKQLINRLLLKSDKII